MRTAWQKLELILAYNLGITSELEKQQQHHRLATVTPSSNHYVTVRRELSMGRKNDHSNVEEPKEFSSCIYAETDEVVLE